YRHTDNLEKYILRLLVFAAIAQVPYSYFHQTRLNILFGFVSALLILKFQEAYGSRIYLLILPLSLLDLEYGTYPVVLAIAFNRIQEDKRKGIVLFILSTVIYSVTTRQYLQIFSLLTLPLVYHIKPVNFKLDKYIFYWFYPVHLAAMAGIKLLM
ncbi:MAG: conjugal transfer protein TraX, partial [Firmicutes bacterium]|nr:conjugal transfer protein TraX [Bacillota bacterium]